MNRSETDSGQSFGVRRRNLNQERGSGLLSSVIGVGIISAMIGLLANVSIGLWIRSTVDAVAYDAARSIAVYDSEAMPEHGPRQDAVAQVEAITQARALLGEYGHRVSLRFIDSGDPSIVALHVSAPGTNMLPRLFNRGPVIGRLDRVIVIRRERS